MAEQEEHFEVVELLKEAGANMDQMKETVRAALVQEADEAQRSREQGRVPLVRFRGVPGSVRHLIAVSSVNRGLSFTSFATVGAQECFKVIFIPTRD